MYMLKSCLNKPISSFLNRYLIDLIKAVFIERLVFIKYINQLNSDLTKIDNNVKNMNIEGTYELLWQTTKSTGTTLTINKNILNYKYLSVYIVQAYAACVLFVPTLLPSMFNQYCFSFGHPVTGYGAQGNISIVPQENLFTVEFIEVWTGGWPFSEWRVYGIV